MDYVMSGMNMLWVFINSPFGITIVVGIFANVIAMKPLWKRYEGTIIAAIKYAEKLIPDDTENKSKARLDAALKYVLEIFERVNQRSITEKEKHELIEGINLTHDKIDKDL